MKSGVKENKDITIAVLPFQILTDSNLLNNLMIGFTEDLITNLSKFIGLSVISHFSTQHINDLSNKKDIANLNADYIVSGSFMSQGEKVRINIQLIDAESNNVIFAGKHVETPESILEAEDAVTQQVVNVLQQKIDYNLLSYSYEKKSTNLNAYINWLKGMSEMRKGSVESDLKSREYFNEALKIDPNYARAYSGISLSYFNEWSCQLWDKWDVSSKGAQKYALKALELDENDYQSLMVLGRTFLYTEEFEKAEHYFRKSIRMNPNDAKNLMDVAILMLYLGFANEAEKLYNKANKLNPIHQDKYFAYGAFIYLELGQFEKSLEIAKKIDLDTAWVDFPVFMAAAYYHLSNFEKAKIYWDIFIKNFKNHIHRGKVPTEKEALEWQIQINPFKGKNNLREFWNYIANNGEIQTIIKPVQFREILEGAFIQKGEMWEFTFQGHSVLVKHTKGYHDISKLLADPNKDMHCMELMGSQLQTKKGPAIIDKKAKTNYQNKIKTLQIEIEDAKEMNNYSRINALEEEYDALVDHLSQSLGLAGKPRELGSSVEKARSAVTWRIRSAIKKIKDLHPQLATHLSKSINTGTLCSYTPELKVNWTL